MKLNIKATGQDVVISDIIGFYPTDAFFIYTRQRVCLGALSTGIPTIQAPPL